MTRRASATLRRGLGEPLTGELLRGRLVDELAKRWSHRVTLIEAPGGYGKSTALAQAVRDNDADPSGLDLYMSCRPSDRGPTQLASGLTDALGFQSDDGAKLDGPSELADNIIEQLAALAPAEVCLILDDVHELVDAPDATALLARLIRQLPSNAHTVLSGRHLPDLPLAKMRGADEVLVIGAESLAFDDAELALLADDHAIEPASIGKYAGWPAMTRLSIVAGADVTRDYLLEEVIADLTPDQRIGVAAAVLGKRVDDDLLARVVGTWITSAGLAGDVPMLILQPEGGLAAHDLWHEALPDLIDRAERRRLAKMLATWHVEYARFSEALWMLTADERWEDAREVVMAALAGNDSILDFGITSQWLAMFPDHQHNEPEVLLLNAVSARLAKGPAFALDDAKKALAIFRERNQITYAGTACIELGVRGWLLNDLEVLRAVGEHGVELADQGNEDMRAMLVFGAAGIRDLQGDPERALATSMTVDLTQQLVSMAPVNIRSRATYCFLLGRGDEGLAHAEEVARAAPGPASELTLALARWQNGDASQYVSLTEAVRHQQRESIRDEFLDTFFTTVADACFGVVRGTSGTLKSTNDRVRERAFEAIAESAELVALGRENEARIVAARHVADVGDDLLSRWEYRRFVAYGYLLNKDLRADIESVELGPRFQASRSTARALHRARSGQRPDFDGLPSPEEIMCALPMPWSVELAAHAAAVGHECGPKLMDLLLSVIGPKAHAELVRIAEEGDAGVQLLARSIPSPPESLLAVRAIGPTSITRGDGGTSLVQGVRVRQLLELLILRRRVSREQVVAALWPEMPPSAGANNLRKSLSLLRSLLEPDRDQKAPSFHIRHSGDWLWLHESDLLRIDAWDLEQHAEAAANHEAAGRPRAAATCHSDAAELWTDHAFSALRDLAAVAPDLMAWDRTAARAAARAAHWHLAHHDTHRAVHIADSLLRLDPHAESAYQVIISARLLDGDLSGADNEITRCRAMLAQISAGPSPETTALIRRYERRVETRASP